MCIRDSYTYTGREFDQALGLSHFRARMYVPSNGSFCSRDPLKYLGSLWNLYRSFENRPLDSLDPFGLYTVTDDDVDEVVGCLNANVTSPIKPQTPPKPRGLEEGCKYHPLNLLLKDKIAAGVGDIGGGLLTSGLPIDTLRRLLAKAAVDLIIQTIISNPTISEKDLINLIAQQLQNSLGEALPAGTISAIRELVKSIRKNVKKLGPDYGCKMVTLKGESSFGEKSACTFMLCLKANGAFIIPFAHCSYTCKKGKHGTRTQNCCCGESLQVQYENIHGNLKKDPCEFNWGTISVIK